MHSAHAAFRFMIFMIPIVHAVKKISENEKKNLDNHIRFFLYEKFKELDYISNHKIQYTCI